MQQTLIYLSSQQFMEIDAYLARGEKIQAIKFVRETAPRDSEGVYSSIGLKEAKEAVESYGRNKGIYPADTYIPCAILINRDQDKTLTFKYLSYSLGSDSSLTVSGNEIIYESDGIAQATLPVDALREIIRMYDLINNKAGVWQCFSF